MITLLTAPALALAISLGGLSSIPTRTITLDTEVTAHTQLPCGDLLVGQSNGEIWRVDSATGRLQTGESGFDETALLGVHAVAVKSLCVDASGEWVASVGANGKVALWETSTVGKKIHECRTHPEAWFRPAPEKWASPVPELAWITSGKHLITWLEGKLPVMFWNRDGQLTWTGPMVTSVDISPVDDTLAGVSNGELWIKTPTGEVTPIELEHEKLGAITCVGFSPDGQRLVVGTSERQLCVIEVGSQRVRWGRSYLGLNPIIPLESSSKTIANVHWSPNGKWVGFMIGLGMYWPAVVKAADGSVVLGNLFMGGNGSWLRYDFAWTRDSRMTFESGRELAMDVETENCTYFSSDGDPCPDVPEEEDIWFGQVAGKFSAVDLKTGRVQWTR